MLSTIKRRISYANVVATLALVFAMSGGALAATHYLINSTKQINPRVLKQLRGKSGRNGTNGATGPAGAQGPPGNPGPPGTTGKEGPQGPGATETVMNLPASTSPTFSKVGTVGGTFTLEAECAENGATHGVTLKMTYTSPVAAQLMQTEFESVNGGATVVHNSSFSEGVASEPAFWDELSAETGKASSQRYDGEYLGPKLIYSESYWVTGGPSGKCEAALGAVPAS
jgi:hypothetical protein